MSSTYHNAGFETIDGFKIKNSNSTYKIGQVDMMFAFKNSFNTGSIHVLRGLDGNYDNLTLKDKEVMYEYYHDRFKLGVKTGVGVNEASGLVYGPSSVEGTAARYANMTFGQGLLTTPIQLATAYSAVVNGGIYRGATILAEMDGAGNYVNKNVQGERAIKETTSAELRNMLVETWKNYNSRNPLRNKKGVTIGAKTGTGQVASASGGYQGANEQIASVAGFVGEELPEYVIIVKIGGGGNFWGSEQAMPVFNRIVEYLINYQNIGV
jgi:cell division protein FtsI/penicillin-binding protein 2